MSAGAVVRQERPIPDRIRALTTFERVDYADAFTVAVRGASASSPEEWARALVEDAAGAAGQFVWRRILGLGLEPRPSAGRIGGWEVADRGDDWIRLEARSWFMAAQIAAYVSEDEVTAASFVRYDHPIARVVWVPVSIAHQRALPGLLRAAVGSVSSKRAVTRLHDGVRT